MKDRIKISEIIDARGGFSMEYDGLGRSNKAWKQVAKRIV